MKQKMDKKNYEVPAVFVLETELNERILTVSGNPDSASGEDFEWND